jgi:hypothetical protein
MTTIKDAARRLDESNAEGWIALIAGIGIVVFLVSPVLLVITLDSRYNDRFSGRDLIVVRLALALATTVWWIMAAALLGLQQGTVAMLAGFVIGYAELKRELTI